MARAHDESAFDSSASGTLLAMAGSMRNTSRPSDSEPYISRPFARGVTLIEVILVVAIIAMVAAAASVSGIKVLGSSQKKTAHNDVRTIRAAVRTWWLTSDPSRCPTLKELVAEGILDPDGHQSDPWGTAFAIACDQREAIVRSAGPDRKLDTEDDIQSPPKE